MEKSFIDLLEREKICVDGINRAEGNIEMWRVEMIRLQNTYRQSEYRDADISSLRPSSSTLRVKCAHSPSTTDTDTAFQRA